MATHADREDETNSAFTWCLERLERDASARLAVVIPPAQGLEGLLERWEHTLEKRFESDSGGASIVRLSGRQVGRRPVIGAALDLLTLFSSTGSFPVLSRVLRSPFLGMTEENRGRAAMLEGELREDLSAQASFIEAFRFGGLRVRLNRALPELAEGLVVLMQQLEGLPLAQTTTAWGRFMHEVLVALGWPGTECVVAEDDLDAWYRAVAELAELTPILGALSFDRALAELERIVSRARITEAPSLRGVSMFTSLEQVGVGYDAAWVAGMSDSAWPGPSRPHALFPLGLQRAHDMPDATPETALLQRQSSIDDLVARVPDLVFSYARIEDDLPVGASPLIGDLAPIESSPSRRASVRAVEPVLADAIEEVDDPVPALDGRNVPGGASTLALQARCPLRAFIEARLDARPLSRQERGIGPRLRGILVHRALELFYADCGGKGELDAMPDAELEARIRASIDRSFRERLHVVGGTQRGLRALERERLGRLILSLVDADRQRDEFSIEARELRTQVELLGRQISCRIDRVDRLADGRLAIIDYKTGRPPTSRQWLASRLIEPQLPLYVQAVQESVGAIIVAVLRPDEVVYRGLWDVARAFPGRAPAVDWQQQCMDWSAQISTLVAEFIAGDGRVFAGAIDQAVGPFAPLTRACGLTQDAFEAETGSES